MLNSNHIISDYHPVSLLYRFRRRIRMMGERKWPRIWISRMMQMGVNSVIKTSRSVSRRLEGFAENIPFADVDFSICFSKSDLEKLRICADEYIDHQIDLLGSGPVSLGEKMKWHSDYVTGFQWDSSRVYLDVRGLTPAESDIKRPWELSRCQHFVPLGLGWRLFSIEKYKDEFVSEIEDWIEQNPVGYGVNWACSMEVGIRAVNWLVGYALFCPGLSGAEYESFRKKLTASFWEHGRFIKSHLEWNGPFSERRANHFLANLSGLFTLGIFFSDTWAGRRWLFFAQKRLEKEIHRQVLKDGVHFECTTSYHRLCLEMFMWCYFLGARHHVQFSRSYNNKIKKMKKFSSAYTRPDGMAPLFGDNDDGRLLFSGLGFINDHRYLFDRRKSGAAFIDAVLLSGNKRFRENKDESGFQAFKTGGFYVIKRPDMHLVIRAGSLGQMGAHAHCDQLSFELSINKFPIFVDRGAYVYLSDPAKRNLYRGTRAHNVVSVNGAEQNRAQVRAGGELFGFFDETQTRVLNANEQEVVARHTGFKALMRDDIAHKRTFHLPEGERVLNICDEIEGLKNGDSVEWFFHLAPGLEIVFKEHSVVLRKGPSFICRFAFPEEMILHKVRFDHSPSYGRLEIADALFLNMKCEKFNLSYRAQFVISWGM